MITIYHGDDLVTSRREFLKQLDLVPAAESMHVDSKNLDPNQINNFLSGGSLFSDSKTIAIDNFFSTAKATLTKIEPVLTNSKIEVLIWQDKPLNATQLKVFPQAKLNIFKLDNSLFKCLNSLKPHNLNNFSNLFDQVLKSNLYDLFFYLLKGSIRKQLLVSRLYSQDVLTKTYLQLIDLEFQNKSGQLVVPREIALQRVLLPLLR